jgi:hypothetical protein
VDGVGEDPALRGLLAGPAVQSAGGFQPFADPVYKLTPDASWELTALAVTGNSLTIPPAITKFTLHDIEDFGDLNDVDILSAEFGDYLTWTYESPAGSPITISENSSVYSYNVDGDYANYYAEIDVLPTFDYDAYNTDNSTSLTAGDIEPIKIKIINGAVIGDSDPEFTLESSKTNTDGTIYYNSENTTPIPLALTPNSNNPYNPITDITWAAYDIDGTLQVSDDDVTNNSVLSSAPPYSFASVYGQSQGGVFNGVLTLNSFVVDATSIWATISLASGDFVDSNAIPLVDDTILPTVDVTLNAVSGSDTTHYQGISGTVIVTDTNYDLKDAIDLPLAAGANPPILHLSEAATQPSPPSDEHHYTFTSTDFPDGTFTKNGLTSALRTAISEHLAFQDKASNASDKNANETDPGYIGVTFGADFSSELNGDDQFLVDATPLEVKVAFNTPTNDGTGSGYYQRVTGTIIVLGDNYSAASSLFTLSSAQVTLPTADEIVTFPENEYQYKFEIDEGAYNKGVLKNSLKTAIDSSNLFKDNTGRGPDDVIFEADGLLVDNFTIDYTNPKVDVVFDDLGDGNADEEPNTIYFQGLGGTITVTDKNYNLVSTFDIQFTDSSNEEIAILSVSPLLPQPSSPPSPPDQYVYSFTMYPNSSYSATDFEAEVISAIKTQDEFKDMAGNAPGSGDIEIDLDVLDSNGNFVIDSTPPYAMLKFDAPSAAAGPFSDSGDAYYQYLRGTITVTDDNDNIQTEEPYLLDFNYNGESYTLELYNATPTDPPPANQYTYQFNAFPDGHYTIQDLSDPSNLSASNLAVALKSALETAPEFRDAAGNVPEGYVSFGALTSELELNFVVDTILPVVEVNLETIPGSEANYRGIRGAVTVTDENYKLEDEIILSFYDESDDPRLVKLHLKKVEPQPTTLQPDQCQYEFDTTDFSDDFPVGTFTKVGIEAALKGALSGQNPSQAGITDKVNRTPDPDDISINLPGFADEFIVDTISLQVVVAFDEPTKNLDDYLGDAPKAYYYTVTGTVTVNGDSYITRDSITLFKGSPAVAFATLTKSADYEYTFEIQEENYTKSELKTYLEDAIKTASFSDHSFEDITGREPEEVEFTEVPTAPLADDFVIDSTPPQVSVVLDSGVKTPNSDGATYYRNISGTVIVEDVNHIVYDDPSNPLTISFLSGYGTEIVSLVLQYDSDPSNPSTNPVTGVSQHKYTFSPFPDVNYPSRDALETALKTAIVNPPNVSQFVDKGGNQPIEDSVDVDLSAVIDDNGSIAIDTTSPQITVHIPDPVNSNIVGQIYTGETYVYYTNLDGIEVTIDDVNYEDKVNGTSLEISAGDGVILVGDSADDDVLLDLVSSGAGTASYFFNLPEGTYATDDFEAALVNAIISNTDFYDMAGNVPLASVNEEGNALPDDFILDRTPLKVAVAFASDDAIDKYENADDDTAYFQNLTATVELSDENKLQNLAASINCGAFTLEELPTSPLGGQTRIYGITFASGVSYTYASIVSAIKDTLYDKAGNHPVYTADGADDFTFNLGSFNLDDPIDTETFTLVVDTTVPLPSISSVSSITGSSNQNGTRDTFDENDDNQYSIYGEDGVTATLGGRDGHAGIWKLEYFKIAVSDVTANVLNTSFNDLYSSNRYERNTVSVDDTDDEASSNPRLADGLLSYNETYENGDRFIYVLKATDKSGMIEYYISDGLIVDTFDPVIESLELASSNLISNASGSWLYNGSVTVNFTASDNNPSMVPNDSHSAKLSPLDDSLLEYVPVSSGLEPSFNWEVTKGGQAVAGLAGTPTLQAIEATGGLIGAYATNATPTWNDIVRHSQTAQGTFTISATPNNPTNNYNDLVAEVWVQDATGNEVSTKTVAFSIDTMGPVVSVAYDNDDVRNNRYFNAGRTATVTVSDHNFLGANMNIAAPGAAQGSWSQRSVDGDTGTYTTTVSFATDGDYTLDITGRDAATNSLQPVSYAGAATQDFTVDLTNPVLSVAYDNNDVRNDRYYNAARTGTVTVVEHNFGSGEGATITASRDGAGFSSGGGWGSSGDTHTSSIPYSTDGDYDFHVEYTDLAGNPANAVSDDNFVVDLTTPTLEFLGAVQNMTAFNTEEITPEVAFHDRNYDNGGVGVTLHKVERAQNSDSIDPRETYLVVSDGQEASVNVHNAEVGRAGDGIYTLTAQIVDLAGNEFEDSIIYSVNRYGSTWYIEDGSTTDRMLDAYYTNAPATVEVHEINATEVNNQRVSFANAGTVTDMAQGQGYTVASSGGEAQWKDYIYRLAATNFVNEGLYEVTIYSEDIAGNTSTNRAPKVDDQNPADSLPVDFVVDVTAPSIVLNGVEDNGRYAEAERIVKLNVEDNLALDMVDVYLNDSTAPSSSFAAAEIKDAGGTVEFRIPTSADLQTLRVNARDMAGNASDDTTVSNIFVNPSPLAQFIRNTPLFVGSIVGVLAVAAAIAFFIFFWRRRRKEDENKA